MVAVLVSVPVVAVATIVSYSQPAAFCQTVRAARREQDDYIRAHRIPDNMFHSVTDTRQCWHSHRSNVRDGDTARSAAVLPFDASSAPALAQRSSDVLHCIDIPFGHKPSTNDSWRCCRHRLQKKWNTKFNLLHNLVIFRIPTKYLAPNGSAGAGAGEVRVLDKCPELQHLVVGIGKFAVLHG